MACDRKFLIPYIKFINNNFNEKEHYFFIISNISKEEINFFSEENFFILENKIQIFKLLKIVYKAKSIYLHGLFNKWIVIFLFLQPWLLKKCNWIMWGGDLYYYKNRDKTLKSNIYEVIRKNLIKKLGNITSLVPDDYKVAQKVYNMKAKYNYGMYINPIKKSYLDQLLDNNSIREKKSLYIQIGNSADITNNHFEILDMLEKFKDENIKIFAPLSYGDQKYAKRVKEYGELRFKNKFIGMMEFLPANEYSNYLSQIDIAIFNHKRQQGLGNIYALLYLGTKVYIRNDVSTWSYLNNRLDFDIYNTLDIKNINYDKFKKNDKKEYNQKKAVIFFDENYIKKVWEKIFNKKGDFNE
ncbi:TDP-N-acetylfucosamine:lipid II N-acetylfucosaminyltransferase [Orenia metallireducens]|uniref:TDP-N-acetylfucosamine:lipid II N-acetylfucosaminyltransferase n=1 Tax=Orenia metallireducens TaxID=1413210 RepID=UPI0015E5C1AF|nr:TDP-N-acetylfucosamine:lipid II N-acetylfucosaminyltransferase [Orenia metallireducens]